MTRSYSDFTSLTRSSKLVLCHIEPVQRLSVFTLESGTIYSKNTNYFVIDVKEDGTSLTEASSASLSSGEWYYDPLTSKLWVNSSDDLDPSTHTLIVKYRLFYANVSIDLPYDLASGVEVNYDGRLKSNSPIRKELDEEQIGVVLETATSIKLENSDAYFDDIYDVLIFENKDIKLYSWSEIIPLTEKLKLFDGQIQNKTFAESSISFSCKDFTYKLREPVKHINFTASDGTIAEQYLYTPKRRLFGQFKQLQCVPIDATLSGFNLTGTVSVLATNKTQVVGVGTSFLDQASPKDEIIYVKNNVTYRASVDSVSSNTLIILEDEYPVSFADSTVTLKPAVPYRKKNRRWHIAGHKLRSVSTTIATVASSNRFSVADASELFAGDLINVNGEDVLIRRISGNNIVLRTNLQAGLPSVGYTVTKNPVSRSYSNGREAVISRDYTIENSTSDAVLVFEDDFEFNIAPIKNLTTSLVFTNSSNQVTISGGGDPRGEISVRDWIQSGDEAHQTWYEILSVTENLVELRSSYLGGNNTSIGKAKNVTIVDDNSIITVDCLGQDSSNKWIKTASDAVLDLIETDAALTNIDAASFVEAREDSNMTLSYVVPDKIGGRIKSIRDVVSDINESVFGSLVLDNDFNLAYKILTSEKPTTLTEIKDDDLSNPNIRSTTRNKIVRKVNANYSFFTDKFTGKPAFELYEYVNEFVDNLVGITDELNVDLYLFNESDAETITQRYALYNSLSQSIITVSGKLNLSNFTLNDAVWLGLDRLYKRFGNRDSRKVGIINKITNDGTSIILSINDLGNAINRIANISSDTANDFTSATEDEKIIYNYIVDDNTLTPSTASDNEVYSNQIG